mmetsp:Transcript_30433/g.48645  ORF Transcript_30433/g.48645 Transcript_30433/m.48645 type:complete len:719 (+) Transcript_30433:3-2159(+)
MFEDEAFLVDGFDADKFVADHRRNLTLETLHGELEKYVAHLDDSLVNIINNDYSSFLKLSSMLVDIDLMVAGLRNPLKQLESKVECVRGVVNDPLEYQSALLDRFSCVHEKKKVIQLCLSAWESLEKVDHQVQQFQKKSAVNRVEGDENDAEEERDPEDEEDEETNEEALGRATQRLARVSFLGKENAVLPLLRMIRARARNLENSVTDELEKSFVNVVKSKKLNHEEKVTALASVLRAYVAINHIAQVETVFKEQVVMPYLEEILTRGRLDAGGPRGDACGLAGIFRDILQFIQTDCLSVLEASQDRKEGLGKIDFVGKSVAEAVYEGLKKRLPEVYTSGVADTLHSTYVTTRAFFDILEAFASNPVCLQETRGKVLELWNMSVYMQLRTQEFCQRLDAAMSTKLPRCAELCKGENVVFFPVSTMVLESFDACWSPKIFINAVSSSILKLSLQLVTRFIRWGRASVKYMRSQHIEGSDVDQGGVDDPLVIQAWSDASCDTLLYLASDCISVSNELVKRLNNIQEIMFPGLKEGNETREEGSACMSIQHVYTDILGGELLEVAKQAKTAVVEQLVKDRVVTLDSGVMTVAPMYRMTNKPVPTDPSSYAKQLLKPLGEFLDEQPEHILSTQERKEIAERVFCQLLTVFESKTSSILEEIKKTEKAVRRLKRGAVTGQMDSDKMCVQFKLDLECIAEQIAVFGVEPESLEQFKNVLNNLN